jgi:1-acyl-sn-glycerol-3-phosphate acyltransferase
MPPTPVRRPLTITAWLVLSTVCLALSPLLLVIAAIAAALIRRPQPLILARLLIAYFARELGVLLACGALWLLSGFGVEIRSPRFRQLHYRLLHWFVHGLSERARHVLEIEVTAQPTREALTALQADRPLLFFSRHAGPGDTVLLTDLLLNRYRRTPSVVFKETLAIDPSVDLIGHRLPHAILDTSDPIECEARIQTVSAELGPRGVLILFPEGANFTAERRRAALRKLLRKGLRREAAAGESMPHVLPPHPAGALAALRGCPDCDVIFSAHTGLGLAAFPGELWRQAPIGETLDTQMWLSRAAERPTDADQQVQWLYDWWKRIDEWIDSQGEEAAGGVS